MILTVFIALNALGFATWILGSVFRMQEVQAIGGVIIVGAGLMVINSGLEYRSGQSKDFTYNDSDTTKNPRSADVQYQYSQVPLPQQYSLGFMIVLLGSVGMLRSFDTD